MISFTEILNPIKEFFGGQGYYGQAKDPRLLLTITEKLLQSSF